MGVSSISLSVARDAARGQIERQLADLHHGRRPRDGAAADGLDAGHQLDERERLDDVIVGAGVQARHALLDRAQRREQRSPASECPRCAARSSTSSPGRPGSIRSSMMASNCWPRGQFQPALAILGPHAAVPGLGEALAQRLADHRIVFDDQQLHARILLVALRRHNAT